MPQKTCGLFDTGSAGEAFDFASLDLSIPVDIDQSLFAFGDTSPSSSFKAEPETTYSTAAAVDQDALVTEEMPSYDGDFDWNLDLLDPLGGLDDPLGDEKLDAFVNLDSFLMEDSFLVNQNQMKDDPAEVTPVIDFFANPGELGPATSLPTTLFDGINEEDLFQQPSTSQVSTPLKTTRKRKAPKSKGTSGPAPIKTSPQMATNCEIDHDYTWKTPGLNNSEFQLQNKQHAAGPGKKNAAKRSRIPSDASDSSVVSSTSVIDVVGLDSLDKHTVRRIKNNVASKKSREQRKQKFADLDAEAETLIVENDRLRAKIVELEKIAKEMKAALVAKMTGQA